jgi:negative regulator of genetic competence, sporulation and motility
MKTLLIIFSFLTILTSCSSDDVTSTSNASINGTWKVKSFIDNKNRDRTSYYAAYNFDFKTSGELVVSSSSIKYNGTYSSVMDSGKQKFYITITTSDDEIDELNEDWILAEKTDTIIKLTNKWWKWWNKNLGFWEVKAQT